MAGSGSMSPSGLGSSRGVVREVTREVNGSKFEISVDSLVSDGSLLELSVRIKRVKAGDGSTHSLNVLWASPRVYAPAGLRLVDFDAAEVLPIGSRDGEFAVNPVSSGWADEKVVKAYFAAPMSDRVTLMLPSMGVIHDLEVTRGDAKFALPEGVDDLSRYVFERCAMEVLERPYESEGSVRIDSEMVRISIPSDILFEFGAAELTEGAVASITSVHSSIGAYGAEGKLTVIGYTDDQGSDAINGPLSVERADAVAGVLTHILSSEYEIEAKGVGSSQPAVAGTSDDARKANRRVEIEFEYASEATSSETVRELPTAPEAVSTAHDPVVPDVDDPTLDVRVESVERVDGYLIGSFRITALDPTGIVGMTVFSPADSNTRQSFDFYASLGGGANATLLTSNARVFPIEYRVPSLAKTDDENGNWHSLCDRSVGSVFVDSQQFKVATVVWPDPGTETVTIDVAGSWRIMEVPVGELRQG